MRFKIIHESNYHFANEVFLEPHYFRFKPKTTPHQQLESFNLKIAPVPAGTSEQIDIDNNLIHFCWFDGLHQNLSIRAESVVNIQEFNPFNYLLYPPEVLTIPFQYPESSAKLLQAALSGVTVSRPLSDYGQEILKETNFNTSAFLSRLTQKIHEDFSVIYRDHGAPLQPDESFALKNGSCRDLTWMQIQLLRSLGLAARFVSGYYYVEMEKPEFELHAWLEVFLPGAGWIAYDPSHGIAVGNAHIPVVSSAHFEHTMPVSGTIRGDASSVLSSNLLIEPKI